MINGYCEEKYNPVKKIFESYFLKQEEIGASFAIYKEGKPLIDLYGGFKNKNNKNWEENTIVNVFSATKGIYEIIVSILIDQNILDLEKSVSYYLNSSVSQGTIGGVAYRELSKEPIIGTGTDISISTTGYVASYLTDANDPDVLSIPGGNFNCEFYFSVNNNTGNPFFYAELYKYDGTTFTLLGSSVGVPEYINQGTVINPYYFAIPVATAALALTDRLAIRIYVNVDGRTVTLHTENNHLCQVVTTFSKGLTTLNSLEKYGTSFQIKVIGALLTQRQLNPLPSLQHLIRPRYLTR